MKTSNKMNLQASLQMVEMSCKGSETRSSLDCLSVGKGVSPSGIPSLLASAVALTLLEDKSR